jgi:hypothetical protein
VDIARYRRYFYGIEALSWLPLPLAWMLAARYAAAFSPQRAELPQVLRRMERALPWVQPTLAKVGQRYLYNIGVHDVALFLYHRLDLAWVQQRVQVQGAEYLRPSPGRGLFLLSFHHHHNGLLYAVLGLLGVKLSVLAHDPRASPLYAAMTRQARMMYDDSERHFNGGQYLYIDAHRPSYPRTALRVLTQGDTLLSTNDFPTATLPKRHVWLDALGTRFPVPSGSFELALHAGAALACVSLRWLRRDEFVLVVRPLQADTVAGLALSYAAELDSLARAHPAAWEWSALVDS